MPAGKEQPVHERRQEQQAEQPARAEAARLVRRRIGDRRPAQLAGEHGQRDGQQQRPAGHERARRRPPLGERARQLGRLREQRSRTARARGRREVGRGDARQPEQPADPQARERRGVEQQPDRRGASRRLREPQVRGAGRRRIEPVPVEGRGDQRRQQQRAEAAAPQPAQVGQDDHEAGAQHGHALHVDRARRRSTPSAGPPPRAP
jgi:hypothetical protein